MKGRPPRQPMRRYVVSLPDDLHDWIKDHGGGERIRLLVKLYKAHHDKNQQPKP
jgi:hypothetical protein